MWREEFLVDEHELAIPRRYERSVGQGGKGVGVVDLRVEEVAPARILFAVARCRPRPLRIVQVQLLYVIPPLLPNFFED